MAFSYHPFLQKWEEALGMVMFSSRAGLARCSVLVRPYKMYGVYPAAKGYIYMAMYTRSYVMLCTLSSGQPFSALECLVPAVHLFELKNSDLV